MGTLVLSPPPLLPSLIYPIVTPYATLDDMWARSGGNELVSYESRGISRTEEFIILV